MNEEQGHHDTGMRCCVYHYDESSGQGCIHCSCGAQVRPHDWREHSGAHQREVREALTPETETDDQAT
jgi:hypothetical protein